MDQTTKTILVGAVALLILAAVVGTVVFLSRTVRPGTQTDNSINRLPVVAMSPTVTPPVGIQISGNSKVFAGVGFNLNYPKTWGLLTCNNSSNFEFDPYGNGDLKGIVCDRAVKPITVLVSAAPVSCEGTAVKIGNQNVTKSKTSVTNGTNYRWCFKVDGTNFDVTHRVSSTGDRATSKDDFSTQVEEMIKTVQKTPAAS